MEEAARGWHGKDGEKDAREGREQEIQGSLEGQKKRERNYRDDGFSDAADEEAGPAHPSAFSNPPSLDDSRALWAPSPSRPCRRVRGEGVTLRPLHPPLTPLTRRTATCGSRC